MSIIIHRTRGQGFSMLPNDLLRDPAMSARARGVLVTLLSHEDGWQQSAAYTEREMTDGRDSIRSAVRELTDLGYIVRQRRSRAGGKWQTDLHVYDTPEHADSPESAAPTPVSPTPVSPALVLRAPNEEPRTDKDLKAPKASTRPTEDQQYLSARIGADWGKPHSLTIPALQKLNSRYGLEVVTSALRSLHGFPPEEAVDSPYAYIEAICKEAEAS